jgi:hypothetical protein
MCDNCLIIRSVSLVNDTTLVSSRCAGHAALPLYRSPLDDPPPRATTFCAGHRRTALVSAALRWSSPHRPCIGCSALVIGGASVYRGLCVVEKCQFFLQGIKRSGCRDAQIGRLVGALDDVETPKLGVSWGHWMM